MYTFRRVEGAERFRLARRVVENPRALRCNCEERCGRCDDCLRTTFWLWSKLCDPSAAVYALENGVPKGVVVWIGNEMHGHAWDGRLLGKTEVVNEVIEDRLKEYPSVRITVPAGAETIARWATERLGFRLAYEQGNVYHLWRERDGLRR